MTSPQPLSEGEGAILTNGTFKKWNSEDGNFVIIQNEKYYASPTPSAKGELKMAINN